MKKIGIAALIFSSIFLVTAVIGGVLLGTQIATLSAQDIDKIEDIFVEVIEDGSFEISPGMNIHFSSGGDYFSDLHYSTELDFVGSSIDTIELIGGEISDFDATIIRNESEVLKVDFEGSSCYETPVFIETDDSGKAVIRFGDGSNFSVNELDAEVVIHIPASFNGTFEISNGVGEYKISTDIDSLVINDFIGEMEVKGSIGELAIDHCIGEIEIKNTTNFARDCVINNCIGEIMIILPKDSSINVEVQESINAVSVEGVLQGGEAITLLIENNIGEVVVRGE